MNTKNLVLSSLCAAASLFAQSNNLKVTEEKGHLSPVAIRVTLLNGQTRGLTLIGVGANRDSYLTHVFVVRTDGGASQRSLWLDSIAAIHGTASLRRTSDEFTVFLKSGTQVAASFTAWHDVGACNGEPGNDDRFHCNILWVRNEDDSVEKIDLRKISQVEFFGAARKDKAGNAMFDLWRYSPFTGERLP